VYEDVFVRKSKRGRERKRQGVAFDERISSYLHFVLALFVYQGVFVRIALFFYARALHKLGFFAKEN